MNRVGAWKLILAPSLSPLPFLSHRWWPHLSRELNFARTDLIPVAFDSSISGVRRSYDYVAGLPLTFLGAAHGITSFVNYLVLGP